MARKKSPSSRYAIIGLILAAAGCISTAGLAILRGSMSLGLYAAARPETVTQALAVSSGVLVIGVALYGILNPAGVRRFLAGRQARYGSNAAIMTIAFVGILVVVNWLAHQYPQKWDWSEGKKYTLAPETLQALEALPGNVLAKAFYSSQYPVGSARTLLENLKASSKGKFDYEFVDPNSDPVQAQEYGITGDGRIVLILGDAHEVAPYADETTLTQAMIRLISPESRAVYFLTGHGEPDLQSSDPNAIQRAKEALESKNYTVEALNLAASHTVPEDAKAIVIVGATDALLSGEVTALRSYLDSGGALVVLAGPSSYIAAQSEAEPDPLHEYLKSAWSITLEDTVVIDLQSNQPLFAISDSYSSTAAITSRTRSITIMPESRSLALAATPPQNVSVTGLIFTSANSWGETDLQSVAADKVSFDAAADLPGPLALAASAENSKTTGRVVVFGDSAFATNEMFDAYANGEVFSNAVDWAAEEEDLINITPREAVERTYMPPSQGTYLLILLTAVLILPGLVLLAGVSNWLARRRRA